MWVFSISDEALTNLLAHGRGACSTDAPEGFQMFLNGYVPFWNEVDKGCDNVSWETVPPYCAYLTTTLRKRIYDIGRELNKQVAFAAGRLSAAGVFYLDVWQDSYQVHQLYKPGDVLDNPISSKT